jgi:hypothetical protein
MAEVAHCPSDGIAFGAEMLSPTTMEEKPNLSQAVSATSLSE